MRYWLTGWEGPADDQCPVGLRGVIGWTSIDFKPDPASLDGLVLVAVADDQKMPASALLIGDDPQGAILPHVGNALGVNLNSDRLHLVLAELLVVHADAADPRKWNPLTATHDGQLEVHLGGELVYRQPVVSGGAVYTESFTHADVNPFIAGDIATWTNVDGAVRVISNQLDVGSNNITERARAEVDCDTDNNYAQVVYVANDATTSNFCTSICRWVSGANTWYQGCQGDFNTPSFNGTMLLRRTTGSGATLAEGTFTHATNEIIRTEANGSTITLLINGTANLTVTNTTNATGKRAGIALLAGATGRVTVDNFEMGDLGYPYPKIVMF